MKLVVVGAGPAGLNAAVAAAGCGAHVTLLDQMPAAGGRIWAGSSAPPALVALCARAAALGVNRLQGARVIAVDGMRLLVETPTDARWLAADRIVVASGARELQLPFPGWTLPGVIAAGGLQLMVKSGLDLHGRRVVVAGSGPLLLAVADSARAAGAEVLAIAEQAAPARVRRFAAGLVHAPARLAQALRLRAALWRTPYLAGWRIAAADAGATAAAGATDGALAAVRLVQRDGRQQSIACDLLAVGHGLVPELQLPALLGCALTARGVKVDALGASSVPGVYAAGESTGIGGAIKAALEGRIAGLAAAGDEAAARALGPALRRERDFADRLHEAFEPRLDECPRPDATTLICRCEDVPWRAVQACGSWREARLMTRCGMGHCQGRLCGAAAARLQGWTVHDARPPFMPARAGTLAALASRTIAQK